MVEDVETGSGFSAVDWQFLQDVKALENCVDSLDLDTDVVSGIKIDSEKIDQELERQPATGLQWAILAIRLGKIVSLWEATILKQYMGHVRTYAKWYMKAAGEKDTLDGRDETAIKLFGADLTNHQKMMYADMCCKGRALGAMTQTALTKRIEKDERQWSDDVTLLYEAMYYKDLPAYEQIMEQREQYREKRELANAIADAWRQRGFAVSKIADLVGGSNFGEGFTTAARVRNISAAQVSILQHAMHSAPGAAPELLADIVNANQQGLNPGAPERTYNPQHDPSRGPNG